MLSLALGELQRQLSSNRVENQKYSKSINRWIRSALSKMGYSGSNQKVVWVYNPTLTEAIGRAKFISVGEWHFFTYLEFSPTLFYQATPDQRRQVVYHEVAHAVDSFNGTYNPSSSHGKTWKDLMRLARVLAVLHYEVEVK